MAFEDGPHGPVMLELAVSEQSQLPVLREWLRGQQGVEVAVMPGTPGDGEQGALDILTVVAGSSGLVAAIKILPEFIRSRRSGFHIETTVRGKKLVIDASNVEDVLPLLERLLDE
jgi:Effector Associated Constant Component 1